MFSKGALLKKGQEMIKQNITRGQVVRDFFVFLFFFSLVDGQMVSWAIPEKRADLNSVQLAALLQYQGVSPLGVADEKEEEAKKQEDLYIQVLLLVLSLVSIYFRCYLQFFFSCLRLSGRAVACPENAVALLRHFNVRRRCSGRKIRYDYRLTHINYYRLVFET